MITNIRLQNFRSYTDDSFEFESGVNIVVGPNGSGKTNLLEAILVMMSGSSYRVSDEELVKFEQPWARIDAMLDEHGRTVKILSENGRIQKSYIFDEKPYKILTHSHNLPVVLFEPDHLQLLGGQPEARRAYIDTLLEQINPGFAAVRKHYRRVLSQRNALLKATKAPTKDQLFVWNLRLSELGGMIAIQRQQLLDDLQKLLPGLYKKISGDKKTRVAVKYKTKLPIESYETALLKALEQSFELDRARGFTSSGPHRDDFVVSFNDRPAGEVASRGETRTALLAFKIYELELLEKQRGIRPVLLLDDVFSELDGRRRHALASFLQTHQTFITTTDADLVLDKHMETSHIIPLGS